MRKRGVNTTGIPQAHHEYRSIDLHFLLKQKSALVLYSNSGPSDKTEGIFFHELETRETSAQKATRREESFRNTKGNSSQTKKRSSASQ